MDDDELNDENVRSYDKIWNEKQRVWSEAEIRNFMTNIESASDEFDRTEFDDTPTHRVSDDDESDLKIALVSSEMMTILDNHELSNINDELNALELPSDPNDHNGFERACALLRRHSYDAAADYLETVVEEIDS